jgi:hypothetical protein
MDEQYNKLLEELNEIRRNNKDKKITSIRPSGTSSILNMDFSSFYPTVTYHFGMAHRLGNKLKRIIKGKKILKKIKENENQRES